IFQCGAGCAVLSYLVTFTWLEGAVTPPKNIEQNLCRP
ncbi:hypothetical protein X975_00976, partial [Stegodyphus mimosarum]